MNNNAKVLYPFYYELYDKMVKGDFVTDKSGVKTVELIAPRIVFTDSTEHEIIFNDKIRSNKTYLDKEDEWYYSHELKIDKVSTTKIWTDICDENNEVNSNYGNLVYSRNNFSQFDHAKKSLEKNKFSRQAIIIYNRPSIHLEYNSINASDFICTLSQQFLIRNNKLETITSMRSCDGRLGMFNDIPWFHKVINHMYDKLIVSYPELLLGNHVFIPNSLHIYEKHFSMLKELFEGA